MPAPNFPECVDGVKISLVKFNWGYLMNMEAMTLGLDLAKNVFQVHSIEAAGEIIVRKKLRRSEAIGFFRRLAPCLVGMEACQAF